MRIIDILKEIAFERVGGSQEEKKAAEIIANKLRELGGSPQVEEFKILGFKPGSASLSVIKPYKKSYKAYPVGLTGSGEVMGEIKYVETGAEEFLDNIQGKIALVYGRVRHKEYKALIAKGAKGFICVGPPKRAPFYPSVREKTVKKLGKLLGISISFEAGLEIIKRGVKEAVINSHQEDYETTSRNILLELRGTHAPDELIIVCAHYDSVATSRGVLDNGAGAASLVALAEHFIKNPTRRTLRFIWFGSEELGLVGSTHYVDKHKQELDKVKFVVNLDVGGDIFGTNSAIVTGGDDIKHFITAKGKERGLGLDVRDDIYSSDSLPFASLGIPSLNLSRAGGGAFYIHTREDKLDFVDESHLVFLKEAAQDFISFLANAMVFPFKREIPDKLKEKVDEYYRDRMGDG